MSKIKKACIVAGGTIGGIIGGTVSIVGKVSKKSFLEELGENIVDSTIHTGEIAGDVISGGHRVVSGKMYRDQSRIDSGKDDLTSGGGKIVKNFVDNFNVVKEHGGEILKGVKTKDRPRVVRGAKTLGKVIIVSTVTVGAVKTEHPKEDNVKDEQGL